MLYYRSHYIVYDILNRLFLNYLRWKTHQHHACLEVLLEIKEFLKRLKEAHDVFRRLMRQWLPYHPEILGVFEYALQEGLDVADAPDLPAVELGLIVDRIFDELGSWLIVDDLLLLLPCHMIQAELLLLQFGEVVPVAHAVIPLLLFLFVRSLVGKFGGLAVNPTEAVVNWVAIGVLVLKLWF